MNFTETVLLFVMLLVVLPPATFITVKFGAAGYFVEKRKYEQQKQHEIKISES